MSNTKEGKRLKAKGETRMKSSGTGAAEIYNPNAVILRLTFAFSLFTFAFLSAGCRQDMHDQPKYEPLDKSAFFADGRASRPLPDGTVARNQLRDDAPFYTGKTGQGQQGGGAEGAATVASQGVAATPSRNAGVTAQYQGFVNTFPFPIDQQALDRGQERFNIYCSICHGRTGDGLGMIVRRGYRQPPSYHDERLRQAPVGYFFDVITNGFGAMPDYSAQVPPDDRWRIIAYIRALQLSRQGTVADVPPDKRDKIGTATEPEEANRQGGHNQ
jgi:mono/diheme cytochrome c family protein